MAVSSFGETTLPIRAYVCAAKVGDINDRDTSGCDTWPQHGLELL